MEVYFALNRSNGKAYTGWTKGTAGKRFRLHCKSARSGSALYFHRAITKHGADAFDVLTVWRGNDADEMKQVEKNYIAGMRTNDRRFGYNLTEGGEGTPKHKVSAATRSLRSKRMKENNLMNNPVYRQRVSDALMGHVHSDETKKKIGAAQKGCVWSQERRDKASEQARGKRKPWLQGRTQSEEQRAKNSIAQKALWQDPEYQAKMAKRPHGGRPKETTGVDADAPN